MSNQVHFDDDAQFNSPKRERQKKYGLIVRMTLKIPGIDTEKKANVFLLIISIIFLAIAVTVPVLHFTTSTGGGGAVPLEFEGGNLAPDFFN